MSLTGISLICKCWPLFGQAEAALCCDFINCDIACLFCTRGLNILPPSYHFSDAENLNKYVHLFLASRVVSIFPATLKSNKHSNHYLNRRVQHPGPRAPRGLASLITSNPKINSLHIRPARRQEDARTFFQTRRSRSTAPDSHSENFGMCRYVRKNRNRPAKGRILNILPRRAPC